jgi:WD40 repeat protein
MWMTHRKAVGLLVLGPCLVALGAAAGRAAPLPVRPGARPEALVRSRDRDYSKEVGRFDYLGTVESVAFSPDGTKVAAGLSGYHKIYVWDVRTKKLLHQLDPPRGWGFIHTVAFSPDGKTLAGSATGGPGEASPIVLWDVATGGRLRGLGQAGSESYGFALAPDGKTAALACGQVEVYDTASGRLVWKADASNVWGVAYSPVGDMLAALDIENTLTLRSAATGKLLARLPGAGRNLAMHARPAFSPDGNLLAVRNNDRTVDVWDVATLKKVQRLQAPKDRELPLRESFGHSYALFSPDNTVLVSGEYGRTGAVLAVYDVSTGKELNQLGAETSGFKCAAFNSDGSVLATGSVGGAVHLFGGAPRAVEPKPGERKGP